MVKIRFERLKYKIQIDTFATFMQHVGMATYRVLSSNAFSYLPELPQVLNVYGERTTDGASIFFDWTIDAAVEVKSYTLIYCIGQQNDVNNCGVSIMGQCDVFWHDVVALLDDVDSLYLVMTSSRLCRPHVAERRTRVTLPSGNYC